MSIRSGYHYVGNPPVSAMRCKKCGRVEYVNASYDENLGWHLVDSDFECCCGGEMEEE